MAILPMNDERDPCATSGVHSARLNRITIGGALREHAGPWPRFAPRGEAPCASLLAFMLFEGENRLSSRPSGPLHCCSQEQTLKRAKTPLECGGKRKRHPALGRAGAAL